MGVPRAPPVKERVCIYHYMLELDLYLYTNYTGEYITTPTSIQGTSLPLSPKFVSVGNPS